LLELLGPVPFGFAFATAEDLLDEEGFEGEESKDDPGPGLIATCFGMKDFRLDFAAPLFALAGAGGGPTLLWRSLILMLILSNHGATIQKRPAFKLES
jgi:hypothetical protein